MNRRTLFRRLAVSLLATMPVSRTVRAQDAPPAWIGAEFRPITSDAEWIAQGWADDPIVIDYSDQHGAMTLVGEPGPESITMPESYAVTISSWSPGLRVWVDDVEVANVRSATFTARPISAEFSPPFHWGFGDPISTGPMTLEFD